MTNEPTTEQALRKALELTECWCSDEDGSHTCERCAALSLPESQGRVEYRVAAEYKNANRWISWGPASFPALAGAVDWAEHLGGDANSFRNIRIETHAVYHSETPWVEYQQIKRVSERSKRKALANIPPSC